MTRKKLKKIGLACGILLLVGVGAFLGNILYNLNKTGIKGNLLGLLDKGIPLKEDANGRTNILLFGNSEDSQAHLANGAGTDLTDSIMVVSLDQDNHNAVMFSIPRDLWVKYGTACLSGYEGRINVVYECHKQDGGQPAGAKGLEEKVGEVFGLDMHYYIQVNYTALKEAVNAVGGITVQIESDDPRGIYDPNFNWQCGNKCQMVKYPNGPAQLDGEHALALARARGAAGGYGLGGANFDREKYQQKIILALKDKALSTGTLADLGKVNTLIGTIGNNVRTDLQTGEIKTLIDLSKVVKNDAIRRISLIEEGEAVVNTGNMNGQSIVKPIAGVYDYSEVQAYIASKMIFVEDSGVKDTAQTPAQITILNGSGVEGAASQMQIRLQRKLGLASTTGNTAVLGYDAIEWYDLSGSAYKGTAAKLTKELGVKAKGTKLPSGVQATGQFVIILGNE